MSSAESQAQAIIRRVRALADGSVKAEYLASWLTGHDVGELAPTLDAWCARAEQADDAARTALVSLIDALAMPITVDVAQRLREEAVGTGLLALERLLRSPLSRTGSAAPSEDKDRSPRVPDYGKGRPLTLGERKSLARKPDRQWLVRLLADPHPDVMRRALANPRLTEDDVLTVATKRPAPSEVLREIARSTKWMHRPRIRRALVLNPSTPIDVAMAASGLLMRQELRLVMTSPEVSPAVRAVCRERLERLPPAITKDDDDDAPVH